MPQIENDWLPVLSPEFKKDYYKELFSFVKNAYSSGTVFPPPEDIFNAFHRTPFNSVKVVILGQDPYPGVGQAHGLCFSVLPGVKIPRSLNNIYKELNLELSLYAPNNGCLYKWADQGVFLLNTVLTVEEGKPESHKGIGWEYFTDAAIKALNDSDRPIVYLLWGSHARKKKELLNNKKQLVLEAAHPSPLSASRGFFSCGHFKRANEFLRENGLKEIDWQIENI